ncbi:MAG: helix-turn-helix transcriptional regulator, partial [Flavobacteriales bacterium]
GIIQKLEDKIYTEKTDSKSIIHLDKNENLKGLQFLDELYMAIVKKVCLSIKYQSFKAREPSLINFHPYILKEFNNRWFLIGRNTKEQAIRNLALDRIVSIDYNLDIPYRNYDFDGEAYYKNTVGVTVLNDDSLKEIKLKINRANAPYVLTKPFHHSQEFVERLEDGSVIVQLKVHTNFELERLILGFGSSIEVLSPRELRGRIKRNLTLALENY